MEQKGVLSMMDVYLYGKLRRHAPETRASGESVVRLEPQPEETVRSVMERVGVSPEDVYHIFLNGAILGTKNSMAPWLRYQQATDGPAKKPAQAKALDTPVHDGDRLGLFACDMALLVV
jgi:hypothetical protein